MTEQRSAIRKTILDNGLTVLLREILAQFSGNELYVGLVIGVWIAAEALGALDVKLTPAAP